MNRIMKLALGLAAGLSLAAPVVRAGALEGEIAAGAGGVQASSKSPKLEQYRDLPGGLLGPEGWLSLEKGDLRLKTTFSNLSVDNRQLGLSISKGEGNNLEANFTFKQSPRLYTETGQTLFTEVAPGVFRLPDSLQLADEATFLAGSVTLARPDILYNNLVNAENNSALPVTVRFRDTQVGGEITYHLRPDLSVKLNAGEKIRKGHRPIGATMNGPGGSVIDLMEPLDQLTTEGGAALEWLPNKAVVQARCGFSTFRNNISTLEWDSPYRLNDLVGSAGSSSGRMDLVPDNHAQFASLAVSSDHLPKTRLTANISGGVWTQKDSFLPFTANKAITYINAAAATVFASDPSTLPAANFDGKVETVSQQYQATIKPVRKLSVVARYRDYRMFNKSADYEFDGRVAYDATWSAGPYDNHHFGYRKGKLEGQVRYDVLKQVGVNAVVAQEETHRHGREAEESKETILQAGLDVEPVKGFQASVDATQANRKVGVFEIEDYENPAGTAYIELPGLRRYDSTNRFRKDLRAGGTVELFKNCQAGYNYTKGSDDFRPEDGADLAGDPVLGPGNQALQYGLLVDDHELHTVTLDLQVTEKISLSAFGDRQIYNATQRHNANSTGTILQNAQDDWVTKTQEKYDNLGLDAAYDINDDLTAEAGWDQSKSKGLVMISDLPSTATTVETAVPDTKTCLETWNVKLTRRFSKTFSVTGFYRVERYTITDYGSQYVGYVVANPTSVALQGLMLGEKATDYVAYIGGAQVAAKF